MLVRIDSRPASVTIRHVLDKQAASLRPTTSVRLLQWDRPVLQDDRQFVSVYNVGLRRWSLHQSASAVGQRCLWLFRWRETDPAEWLLTLTLRQSIHNYLRSVGTANFQTKNCQLVQDSERSFTNSKNIPGMHAALKGNVKTCAKKYNIPENSF